MRVPLIFAIVLSILFAGCAAKDPVAQDDPTGPTTGTKEGPVPPPPDAGGPTADAPAWRPGDWWHWSVVPLDAEPYEATTVVVSADPQTYMIGWSDIDSGLRSQFFHFIPHGAVTREALVWEAHHEPVTWFSFPMTDGANWTGGMWMRDMTFSAVAAEVDTPTGAAPGFRVNGASADNGIRVEYEWSTGHETFTGLRFYLFNDAPWLTLTLLDMGRGRSEPAHLMHSDMAFATTTSLGQTVDSQRPPPAPAIRTIPEGVTHVAIGCYLGGAPGHYGYTLTDQAGESYSCAVQRSDDWFGTAFDHGPVTPGDATDAFVSAGEGSLFVELFYVTVEERTPG